VRRDRQILSYVKSEEKPVRLFTDVTPGLQKYNPGLNLTASNLN
jgi:hypothetical protein